MDVRYHPVANLFPLIEGDAFQEFANDIAEHGLTHPVWYIDEDGVRLIVDGRNRFRACEARKVPIRWQKWEGAGSLVQWVISENLHRRHLKEGERAMLAARAIQLMEAEEEAAAKISGANLHPKPRPKGDTAAKAAKAANVSERLTKSAKKIVEKGSEELKKAVDAGRMSVSEAAKSAGKSDDEQLAAIAKEAERAKRTTDAIDSKDMLDRFEASITKMLRQAEHSDLNLEPLHSWLKEGPGKVAETRKWLEAASA